MKTIKRPPPSTPLHPLGAVIPHCSFFKPYILTPLLRSSPLLSIIIMSDCRCDKGLAMDGPFNSSCSDLRCDCRKCTLCWQRMRNEDITTCSCGADISPWILTYYQPKYDQSKSAQARRRKEREGGLVDSFRDDLIQWMIINRTKKVSEVNGTAFQAIANRHVYELAHTVQLRLFMVTANEGREHEKMPYEVFKALLKEFEVINEYAVATRPVTELDTINRTQFVLCTNRPPELPANEADRRQFYLNMILGERE